MKTEQSELFRFFFRIGAAVEELHRILFHQVRVLPKQYVVYQEYVDRLTLFPFELHSGHESDSIFEWQIDWDIVSCAHA